MPHELRPLRTRPIPDPPTDDGTYLLLLTVDNTPTAGTPVNNLTWVDSTDYLN